MFNFFLQKKKHAANRCIVLYTFDYNRDNTKELFNCLINYFKDSYEVEFKYVSFYDERYVANYGAANLICSEISRKKSTDIVNFSLDTDNLKEGKRGLGIEFNVTRPVHITFFFPEHFKFNTMDYVREVSRLFQIVYGFSYLTTENYWVTAYAIGDWQHAKGALGIERLSKKNVERWQLGCEKIQNGYIRDVYNENILNKRHLTRQVNGKSLQQYILDGNVGKLQVINNDISIWELDDIQLQAARDKLYKSEMII